MNRLIIIVILIVLIILGKSIVEYFNIQYIPKSSMPPNIYKDMVREILENILIILYKNNYTPIIDGGTLLGIIRDNDIIDGDYDSDILMSYNEFNKLKTDTNTLQEITKLYKITKWSGRWSVYNKYDKHINFYKVPHLDIFAYYTKGKCCYLNSGNLKLGEDIENNNWIIKSSYHKNIVKIPTPENFKKLEYFYIPKDYNNYLIDLYSDWKIKSEKHKKHYTCNI